MTRMTLSTRVGADGVLHVPLGADEANREVRVTIEPAAPSSPMSQEEWRAWVRATAGSWQGELERPEQGDYEAREPLA